MKLIMMRIVVIVAVTMTMMMNVTVTVTTVTFRTGLPIFVILKNENFLNITFDNFQMKCIEPFWPRYQQIIKL